ncbi:MAG: hypothetical protein OXC44_08540 [Proteobacteria bacterium]|nr:hypothetical protein [Pseudomonadota bacterium]
MIILYLVFLLLGLWILLKSTEIFLDSAIEIFTYHKFSPFVIGVFVVGFGTSLPELGIAIAAASSDSTLLALGSVVGSNTANIICVFAFALFWTKGAFCDSRHHAPASFQLVLASALLLGLTAWNQSLLRLDSLLLMGFFGVFLFKQLTNTQPTPSLDSTKSVDIITRRDYIKLIVAMLVVIGSARLVAWSAVKAAQAAHVEETFVGLTILALGSSLPELMSSYLAVKKHQMGLVVGNIVGSNMLNTLLVIGSAGLISPLKDTLTSEVIYRDILLALLLAILLWVGLRFEWWKQRQARLISAGLMLAGYVIYIGLMALTATT